MAVERTLSIIKPDAVAKNVIGQILARFESAGLKVVAARMMQLSKAEAEAFYAVHKERPFFKDLVAFMVSGPVMVQVLEGENAIFIIRTDGKESFKGSGFVRGGIYDRIQVHQENDSFTFRDTDALNLYSIKAKGAPSYSESGIFIIRSKGFSAAYPWKLSFLDNKLDRSTGTKTFTAFESEYWLPAQYLEGGDGERPLFDYRREDFQELVEETMRQAKALGATAVVAEVSESSGLALTVRKGKVETIEQTRDKGLGVSVYVGQRRGHGRCAHPQRTEVSGMAAPMAGAQGGTQGFSQFLAQGIGRQCGTPAAGLGGTAPDALSGPG